nr:CRISPR-associated protein Cas4 [Maliibacterium massiliense]
MREDDVLCSISGLQHFRYCPRQWALITMENQWTDNVHTVTGAIFHENAHEGLRVELRGDTLIVRQLEVRSGTWHLHGVCDVVEFHRSKTGVPLAGREGRWQPVPVEYKKGHPKETDADALQLCAQAVCLEDMLCCRIPEAYLYYGEPRKRSLVKLDQELRDNLADTIQRMRAMMLRGQVPRVKKSKACRGCSLADVCLPAVTGGGSARDYLSHAICQEE